MRTCFGVIRWRVAEAVDVLFVVSRSAYQAVRIGGNSCLFVSSSSLVSPHPHCLFLLLPSSALSPTPTTPPTRTFSFLFFFFAQQTHQRTIPIGGSSCPCICVSTCLRGGSYRRQFVCLFTYLTINVTKCMLGDLYQNQFMCTLCHQMHAMRSMSIRHSLCSCCGVSKCMQGDSYRTKFVCCCVEQCQDSFLVRAPDP